ncbi:oogenesis-related isoform X2 [Pristis pectinata]|uniref:oogenesis-related isoform X2 n=1 Tax=Pristis pectinata TaxID=685728 RepID=UPI00223D55C1|nr:oogenesis-related isoform X2 [Pristis pectinata]
MSLQEDVVTGEGEVKHPAAKVASSLTLLSRLLAPVKYLFGVIRRLSTWAIFSPQVEVRAADSNLFPERRWHTVKKRLSVLARLMLAILPRKIQGRLGLPVPRDLGRGEISGELRKSPNKPHGKGSKRKQDDLAEEELCWIESLSGDLSDADDLVADPNYEEDKNVAACADSETRISSEEAEK